jgi:hypothetical protein
MSGMTAGVVGRRGTPTGTTEEEVGVMATGETGFSDVVFDLVSVQYHALKGGHDYGQYVRDARNAGYDDIAEFFERVMEEDATRASTCHDLLAKLSSKEDTGAAVS